jgi:hypothetical protein
MHFISIVHKELVGLKICSFIKSKQKIQQGGTHPTDSLTLSPRKFNVPSTVGRVL